MEALLKCYCNKLLLLLSSVLLPLVSVHGQTARIDSLQNYIDQSVQDSSKVNALNDLAFELHPSSPRKTIKLSNEAISLSQKINYQKGLAKANNLKGIGYWFVGEYDSSLIFFQKAYLFYGEINYKKGQSDVLNNIGNLYRIQGNYPKSIENYQKSLKIDEERQDEVGMAISMINIGLIFKNQKDWDKALQYYQNALDIFKKAGHDFGIGVALGNIGEILFLKKQYDNALDYYHRAITQLDMIDATCRAIFSELGIGDVYRELEQADSAITYYQRAMKTAKECENPFVVCECLLGLGEVMLSTDKQNDALAYFDKAFEIATQKKFIKQKGEAAKRLSGIYEKQDNTARAFEFYKIYHDSYDSLINEDKIKEIARIEYDYKIEKERNQALLEQERKELLYQSKLHEEELLRQIFIGIILFILLIAMAYYILYLKKKKHSKLLEEKNELITEQSLQITKSAEELKTANNKLQELSDFREGLTHMIVHDMKNYLNVILGLSEREEDNRKMNLISQSARLMLNLVMNMLQARKFEEAGIVLNLQKHKVGDIIAEAEKQIELSLQTLGIELQIKKPSDFEVKLDKELMSRVLVNLLNNAIKYSPVGNTVKIVIAATGENEKDLQIKIIDQGPGVSPEKLPYIFDKYWQDTSIPVTGKHVSTGLGLTFCKLAVEAHQGTIEASSTPGKGVIITMDFPSAISAIAETEPAIESSVKINREVSVEDSEDIHRLKRQLQDVKVYQLSKLQELLKDINDSKWKKELQATILRGDEIRYKKLIEIKP